MTVNSKDLNFHIGVQHQHNFMVFEGVAEWNLMTHSMQGVSLAGLKIYYSQDSSYQDTFETSWTVQRSEFFWSKLFFPWVGRILSTVISQVLYKYRVFPDMFTRKPNQQKVPSVSWRAIVLQTRGSRWPGNSHITMSSVFPQIYPLWWEIPCPHTALHALCIRRCCRSYEQICIYSPQFPNRQEVGQLQCRGLY